MTPEQRAEVLARRKERGYPWHAPPHFEGEGLYMLSATCYEHRHVMAPPARRTELAECLLCGMETDVGAKVHAWVVLPNHYHVLAHGELAAMGRWMGRLHNGKSTQWNRQDGTPGRRVWRRYTDRRIRNERHYYASVNYIHGNPVKHGYVTDARAWPWSSLHEYLEVHGRERLVEWWRRYPVRDYGRGWDE